MTDVAHYFVVRYMFNELGDEAANIGVIVAGRHPKEVSCRFLDDLKAKARADVPIDPDVVQDFRRWLEREIVELTHHPTTPATWFSDFEKRLREKTGNIIRILGPRPVLAADATTQLAALFDERVAPRTSRAGAAVGRQLRRPSH